MLYSMGISQRIEVHVRLDNAGRPARGADGLAVLRVAGARHQLKSFQERLVALAEAAARAERGMPVLPRVDAAALEQMTVMGYPREQAQCALVATGSDLSHAIHWLAEHEGQAADEIARAAMAGADQWHLSAACPANLA
jgi:UBA/TS-N domain